MEKGTKKKNSHRSRPDGLRSRRQGQGPELVLIQISILRIIRPLHRQTYLHGSPVSSRKKVGRMWWWRSWWNDQFEFSQALGAMFAFTKLRSSTSTTRTTIWRKNQAHCVSFFMLPFSKSFIENISPGFHSEIHMPDQQGHHFDLKRCGQHNCNQSNCDHHNPVDFSQAWNSHA